MHTAALHLAPILAAEKSKVPFYVAGGVLVGWALVVSLGLGLRRVDFPRTPVAERVVMAISAVLVLAAIATAVSTSGSETNAGAETGTSQKSAASAPTPSPAAPSTPASTSTAAAPPTTATSAPATAPTTATSAPAPAPTAASSLKLAANPTGLLSYDTKQLSAKAGTVAIAFTNDAPLEHNVTIAKGSTVLGATPTFIRGSKTLSIKLAAGKYTFYCSVPGHRQAGMEGTLTVS
jgi:plastocyanin